MLFYHFTAANRLDEIMAEGLKIGDVPINGPTAQGSNAVWLTSSKNSDAHGLGEPRAMTDHERENIWQWKGVRLPDGYCWDDKREIRITVKVASSDRCLKRFLPWSQGRFKADWLQMLIESGGGKRCAKTWWLYFGVIDSRMFVEVAKRDETRSMKRIWPLDI